MICNVLFSCKSLYLKVNVKTSQPIRDSYANVLVVAMSKSTLYMYSFRSKLLIIIIYDFERY